MASTQNRIFTPVPLLATVLSLATVVAMIGAARTHGIRPEPSLPQATPLEQRILRFEDAAQGNVVVRDAKTGDVIQTFGRGEGAFVRATVRALVHDRIKQGIQSSDDFRLETHNGAQLFLIDEASGRAISLNAFGPTNTAAFAAFMSN
jgi:putative photosynthetic complex assembly protein